jgi:hypothetical protein
MFDIFYIGNNKEIEELFPFAKQVNNVGEAKPNTKMFWFVEPDIQVTDTDVFEYRPESYDMGYTHVWKWDSKNYGGVTLLPKVKAQGTKEINKVVCKKNFGKLYTKTPGKYFEKNPYASHVWCIDKEYKLSDTIDWAPGNFEPDFIHSFHLRGQLEHKYPAQEGGIKLYPKDWKTADVKYHNFLDIKLSYPIMIVTDVEDYRQRNTFAEEYVWLVDAGHNVNLNTFDWVPNPFEENMIHAFRMPYQLTEKYPMAMGGIRLVPRQYHNAETKIHPACPIEDQSYDVFYIDDDEFTAETYSEYADRSKTDWFWMVDRDFDFNGKLLFVPERHERDYIHVFKIPNHLDYRYPTDNTDPWDNRCGGVRLVHKDFDYTKHKYQEGIVPVRYDIFFSDNPQDVDALIKKSRTKMFWSIDSEHTVSQVLNYVPTRDEQKYILNFKIGDQLQHKYPDQEGGVYLIPKSISDNSNKKYKGLLNVKKREYPILYVKDVEDLSVVTEDCWLIDKEYQIDDDIDWSPNSFEMSMQHTFHIPNQLKHKYPEKMGGVRWVPVQWNNEYVIHDDIPVKPKKFPIIFVDDPDDYTQAKGECWLIDKDYILDQDFEWVPSNFEKEYIHTFHLAGQLDHKYPKNMGGLRWIPFNWETAETKIHEDSPFTRPVFEKYQDEDEGREKTTKDWFWVIDSDVEVLPDFDFTFVPTVWDHGKTHVWQKLNPVSGRQYDYSGVMLCPKVPQTKGRPKYIREPSCTQKEYPVYYLQASDYENGLQSVYERLSTQSDSNMYWVIDAFTQIDPEFKFDYYPTQWDQKYIHVFLNQDNAYTSVRLVPKQLFLDDEYTDKAIENNSFEHLKQINTIASLRPTWPVIHLQSLEKNEFINAIKDIKTPFVWTIDPDVKVDQKMLDRGYLPAITQTNKVHAWQKVNPSTGKVHAYGGLRLWPTATDYSDIKSDDLKLNRIRNLNYVKEIGSKTISYDIIFLSYKEPNADFGFQKLQDHLRTNNLNVNLIWVRDVKGIFEAHKIASTRASSKMFWVVDADAEIIKDFNFDYIPDVYDQEVVHVWASKNPITQDEYGYGGVKLFPTEMVRDATSWGLDFTTGLSSRFKSMPQVSCITRFNTDAFSTWRSAFRECVKLTLNDDAESNQRLETWLNTRGEEEFTAEAVSGALAGNTFALKNKDNLTELDKINDFEWLNEQYESLNN